MGCYGLNLTGGAAKTIQNLLGNLRQIFYWPGAGRILYSLLLAGFLYLVDHFLISYLNRKLEDVNRRQFFRKIIHYTAIAVLLLGLSLLWVKNLAYLTAVTGFIAAGLTIALRDIIMSLLGWVKMLWSRNIRVGDRIEISNIQGDVVDISPLYIALLEIGNWVEASQSTGRLVFIPNNRLFQEPLYNYSLGFPYLWDEISLIFTFESELKKAREIMCEPVEEETGIDYERARRKIAEAGQRFAIRYNSLTPRTYTSVVDNGVKFTLRYLTRDRGSREIRTRLFERLMKEIESSPEVELAYPTYRIYQSGESDKKVL